jgi:deoxyadenosine/deoxycytidine kinase
VNIVIVGPCASGKSTLAELLRADGHTVRTPGQEHSGIAEMWRRKGEPDLLVFLDVTYEAATRRRSFIMGEAYLTRQHERLAHARHHADLVIQTADLDPQAVYQRVRTAIEA